MGQASEQGSGTDPAIDVVDLCRELVRIDTSNFGDGQGPGERAAAEYVATVLADAGLAPVILESAPRRASVIARWPGLDPSRPGLLLHGHLDVVPAQPEDWSLDPFAGEIRDGCLWGRGTVDMKDMVAMVLSVVRAWTATGRRPPRDIVLAFLADEEAGGVLGAHWLVDRHPELFEGVSEAISEVGGFSLQVAGCRWYTIQTAEKGMAWMRLTANGRAGHGSMSSPDNAVVRLAEAVARLGRHPWPTRWTPTVREFFATLDAQLRAAGTSGAAAGSGMPGAAAGSGTPGAAAGSGTPGAAADPDVARVLAALGPMARLVEPTLRDSATPTMLQAGYKTNVVPGQAIAYVDARFLPGRREEFLAAVDEIIGPHVRREQVVTFDALEVPFGTPLVAAMGAAVAAEDPGAVTVPYMLSGGTDNKAFAKLGIRGYGFVPLRLPPELDFASLFHGVDERVPLDALGFGVRVLERLLETC